MYQIGMCAFPESPKVPDGYREWTPSEIPLDAFFRENDHWWKETRLAARFHQNFNEAQRERRAVRVSAVQDGRVMIGKSYNGESPWSLLHCWEWSLTPFDETSFRPCGEPSADIPVAVPEESKDAITQQS